MRRYKIIGGIIAVGVLVVLGVGITYHAVVTKHAPSHSTGRVAEKKKRVSSASKPKQPSSASKPNVDTAAIRDLLARTLDPLGGTTSAYVSRGDGSERVSYHGGRQRAASSIKLFILAVAYQRAASGQLDLNETHTLTAADQVGGSGTLQGLAPGTPLSYGQLLQHMIIASDNTATNIVIDRLGGVPQVNADIQQLGTAETSLQRKMIDTAALAAGRDNYTSAVDQGRLLTKLYQRQLVTPALDEQMLGILKQTQNRSKLPSALPPDATVYNKTGEYPDFGVQNDAAIVVGPNGQTFIVVVMSAGGSQGAQVSALGQLGQALYRELVG